MAISVYSLKFYIPGIPAGTVNPLLLKSSFLLENCLFSNHFPRTHPLFVSPSCLNYNPSAGPVGITSIKYPKSIHFSLSPPHNPNSSTIISCLMTTLCVMSGTFSPNLPFVFNYVLWFSFYSYTSILLLCTQIYQFLHL